MRARAIGPTLAPDRIEIARTFCSLVVSAARATTTRPVRRLEFAVALTARVSRACVIARVVANIVGVCRPRARGRQTPTMFATTRAITHARETRAVNATANSRRRTGRVVVARAAETTKEQKVRAISIRSGARVGPIARARMDGWMDG